MSYSNEVLTQIKQEKEEFSQLYTQALAKFSQTAVNLLFEGSFTALKADLEAKITASAKEAAANSVMAVQTQVKEHAYNYLNANKAEFITAAANLIDTAALARQQVGLITAELRANLKAAVASELNASDLTAYTTTLKNKAKTASDRALGELNSLLANATSVINQKAAEVRDFDASALAKSAIDEVAPRKVENFLNANSHAVINSSAVKAAASAFLNKEEVKNEVKEAVTQNILLSDLSEPIKETLNDSAKKAADAVFELRELKKARFLHAAYMHLHALQKKQEHLLWIYEGFENGALYTHKIFKQR